MRFLFKTAALVSFAALAGVATANAADPSYSGGYAPHYGYHHVHHAYYGGAQAPHVIVFDPQAYPSQAYQPAYSPPAYYAPTPSYVPSPAYATVAWQPPPRIVAYERRPSRINCLVGRPVLYEDVFSGFGIFNACDGEWVR